MNILINLFTCFIKFCLHLEYLSFCSLEFWTISFFWSGSLLLSLARGDAFFNNSFPGLQNLSVRFHPCKQVIFICLNIFAIDPRNFDMNFLGSNIYKLFAIKERLEFLKGIVSIRNIQSCKLFLRLEWWPCIFCQSTYFLWIFDIIKEFINILFPFLTSSSDQLSNFLRI